MSAHAHAAAVTCKCQQPVPTVEAMADAMRANHGNCTEDVLQALGFPLSFQRDHKDAAVALANKGFVRAATAAPSRNLTDAENEAVAIIGELMPDTLRIVAELQARNFTKTEIDIVLRQARARAALNFARGQVH